MCNSSIWPWWLWPALAVLVPPRGTLPIGSTCTNQHRQVASASTASGKRWLREESLAVCRGGIGPLAGFRTFHLVRVIGRPFWEVVCWGLRVFLLTFAPRLGCARSLPLPHLGVGWADSQDPAHSAYPPRAVNGSGDNRVALWGGCQGMRLSLARSALEMLVLRWSHPMGFVRSQTGPYPGLAISGISAGVSQCWQA